MTGRRGDGETGGNSSDKILSILIIISLLYRGKPKIKTIAGAFILCNFLIGQLNNYQG
ncbi:hypothetical protein CWATWH0402_4472 [Crocosphaera watsonii WH 0402]|uniref:Uncharacterized protein n=1 Tax=Crocosphaera watsonii WH 0402 TaxID=1284629 RepID=T2JMB4_CROWT|nr:hypothetical protein CWATWH0402_4472 [Crocosphaera watsonii WH 0402]